MGAEFITLVAGTSCYLRVILTAFDGALRIFDQLGRDASGHRALFRITHKPVEITRCREI